jgi:ferredoxin
MIITKQKRLDEIVQAVGEGPVFIIGCSECATLCKTGGEEEVLALKTVFEKQKIPVTGRVVLDPACHLQNDKRLLRSHKNAVKKAQKILVLACGNGVQTVSEILTDVPVIAGTDTLFLGEITRLTEFEKRCSLCGDCILDSFIGLCPVTRCPKHMLNGPCGGAVEGKCEIDPELECIWDLIYRRLKETGQLQLLQKIQQPKDWSTALVMRRTL